MNSLPPFRYGQGMFIKHSLNAQEILGQLENASQTGNITITGDDTSWTQQRFSTLSLQEQENLKARFPQLENTLQQTQLAKSDLLIVTIHSSTDQIMQVRINTDKNYSYPSVVYLIQENVSVKILETLNATTNTFQSSISLLFAAKESSCQWMTSIQAEHDSTQLRLQYVECQQNAKVDCFDIHLSKGLMHVTQQLTLCNENAKCSSLVAQLATHTAQLLINSTMKHTSPNTKANMRLRSIANHHAKTAALATININSHARSTQSTQESKGLLLSSTASCDALPVLEVFTEDVSCSHAATISQCDEEEIFYLESRGMSRDEATQMIVNGFCRSLFEAVEVEEFSTILDAAITEVLQ